MSNYNSRIPADRQYQLIMECRSSGLTDYQWCKEHGIRPGTFYNWVSRLRKKACYDIPAPTSRDSLVPSRQQEVVKLELCSETGISNAFLSMESDQPVSAQLSSPDPMIEISIGQVSIRIAGGIHPTMLDQILSFVKDTVC